MHGMKRRASSFNTERVDHLMNPSHPNANQFQLHYGDLTDSTNIIQLINKIQPDEIYHLGAQSHVAVSFEVPEYTANVDGLSTLRILEAIRFLVEKKRDSINLSFWLYGFATNPQTEQTPFYPRSLCGRQTLCLLDHHQLP